MLFPGILQVSPLQTTPGQELNFRLFQRVTAEVLQVSGTQAILSVEGFPVVAQLSSADQAAQLRNQRLARFIITGLADQTLTLKLVGGSQPQTAVATAIPGGRDLAGRLLEQNGLPVTPSALMLVRAALSQRLAVTPELLNEMTAALAGMEGWGQAEAELAAALKAAGLPLTSFSLALASRGGQSLGNGLEQIIRLLQGALNGASLPADVQEMVRANLGLLQNLALEWGGPRPALVRQLRTAAAFLGRSLENILGEQAQGGRAFWPESSLVSLVRLQQMLKDAGQAELAKAMEGFLEDARAALFLNVRPDPVPGRGEWSELMLLLRPFNQQEERPFIPARLRLARRTEPGQERIDPAYTRLVLQVDVTEQETLQVDLALVSRQVRAVVTAPDPQWCQAARTELPALEEGLQELGYFLRDAQVGVGLPEQTGEVYVRPARPVPLFAVDIEV